MRDWKQKTDNPRCVQKGFAYRGRTFSCRNDLNVEIKADGANLKIVHRRLPLLCLQSNKRNSKTGLFSYVENIDECFLKVGIGVLSFFIFFA